MSQYEEDLKAAEQRVREQQDKLWSVLWTLAKIEAITSEQRQQIYLEALRLKSEAETLGNLKPTWIVEYHVNDALNELLRWNSIRDTALSLLKLNRHGYAIKVPEVFGTDVLRQPAEAPASEEVTSDATVD